MEIWNKEEGVCATCIYWNGNREVDFDFIKTYEKEGKCMSEHGFQNQKTLQNNKCSNWIGFSMG